MANKTNKTGKSSAKSAAKTPAYVTLTQEERNGIIAEILASVHTCKEACAYFAGLADKYGKDVAKEILASVRKSVNARKAAVCGDAKSITDRLKDGEKVAHDAWQGVLRDESVQGRQWARAVYESAGCSLEEMVLKYADYVVEIDGIPALCAKRTTRKNPATGERESGYAPLSASVAGWMSAIKTAIKNAKKSALGASRSEYQRTVVLTWGLDA